MNLIWLCQLCKHTIHISKMKLVCWCLFNAAVNHLADVSFGFHWLMAYISCSGLGSMRVSFTGVKWIGGETLQYKMRSTSSFSLFQNLRNVQPQNTHTHIESRHHCYEQHIVCIPPTNLMFCSRFIMAFLMREEEIVPALHKHRSCIVKAACYFGCCIKDLLG